jgi:serine/threonine protein phosphatase 1
MPRVFIIGDIHGCNKTFRKLVLEKISIRKTDKIYCLGDYIDRGPDSKGVIDFIIQLRKDGFNIHTLRGNHEQLLLESEIDEPAKENNRHRQLNPYGEHLVSTNICRTH